MSYETASITGVTAYQVDPVSSGIVFDVTSAAADIKVTLPPPAPNLNFRFVIAATAGTNKITFTASAATIVGLGVGASTVAGTGAAKTNVLYGATAANLTAGDWAEFKSDGVYWQFLGYTQVAAGITYT